MSSRDSEIISSAKLSGINKIIPIKTDIILFKKHISLFI
ncbi:hypothetical protein RFEPED_0088 [Rickettsia felis str. Pedreira]|uniref:Uncharacterized protein n=1 Tax=Rickettsia felis str. Pedreira TaxID=1359196 RepID=A0A0F3MQL2_RICFI|nr:hypothetical protein RFEPED_0088 [Rickettsia felis str. Pedreira]